MHRLVAIDHPRKLEELEKSEGVSLVDPGWLIEHGVDAHWVLASGNRSCLGRCSLWWTRTPTHLHHKVGLIGHYAARDRAVARELLAHACRELATRGCTIAVGPMDGNTWRPYRLITERGSEPPFFLEPDTPDEWPAHFRESDFTPLARYTSTLTSDLTRKDPREDEIARRLHARGLRLRPLDPTRLDEESRRIFAVTTESFRKHFLYTPIAESEYLLQVGRLERALRPELVWLAEQEERLVGFLFAVPDLLAARRGRPVDTIVIKTLAILPAREFAGLGRLLAWRAQAAAHALGYTRAIHALMHDANPTISLAERLSGVPIRRYTLYSRELGR